MLWPRDLERQSLEPADTDVRLFCSIWRIYRHDSYETRGQPEYEVVTTSRALDLYIPEGASPRLASEKHR